MMQHGLAFPYIGAPSSRLEGTTVLQIIPALEAGGIEQTAIEVAAALSEAGARALVATTGGELISELQARGGIWVPFPADSKNPLAMANNVRKLRDLIRAEQPSLVHAHSRAAAWVALGAAQLTGTPLITTFHGGSHGRHAMTQHYDSVMARGDLVLAFSDLAADAVAASFPNVRQRLRVIPLGIDVRAFSAGSVDPSRVAALRQQWNVAPDERIILVPGRLTTSSGHLQVIEAAAKLQPRDLAGTKIVLVGEAEDRGVEADLDKAVTGGGLGAIVRRANPCQDRPAALLSACLVVLPSTQPEASDLPSLEAQAMGVPVVLADHGAASRAILAPPEVPAGQRTGWLVRPGRTDALAEAIHAALLLGASARDTLAHRARSHIAAEFSRDRMVEATLDAYLAVIEGYQPRRARAR